jgi:hypothetical protein
MKKKKKTLLFIDTNTFVLMTIRRVRMNKVGKKI